MKLNYLDEPIDPVDKMYEVDTIKLIKLCKHHRALNMSLSNNLSRPDDQRYIDDARADVYSYIIFLINRNILITK